MAIKTSRRENQRKRGIGDMDEEHLMNQVRHLQEVEGLSIRQVADALGLSRTKATRLIRRGKMVRKPRKSILDEYARLIEDWYEAYPSLKASQVYDRLQTYGFSGGYTTVKEYTRPFRRKKKRMYHELTFLPGEEAQVDWMQRSFPFGTAYGLVLILSYSRYLYCRFYPRQSMEFFLEGHIEAFREIGGIPRRGRYDNLKSVVIKRRPEIIFNSQFLDFARHYGFSLYVCTPGRANEKGRVERVIRDIGGFISGNAFTDMDDLNRKVALWRQERNRTVHRSTGKAPLDLLPEEKLKALPQIPYRAYRLKTAAVTPTGFVHFETNRYSLPSGYSHQPCSLMVYPRRLEIVIGSRTVAAHQRSFLKNQTIEHPLHREKLIQITPHFKDQRILQLMTHMDEAVSLFLRRAEAQGADPVKDAYILFKLLKIVSKATLLSAVRQANALGTFQVSYLQNLLTPQTNNPQPVYPQNTQLLQIDYERRELARYDELI
jgi:transposase